MNSKERKASINERLVLQVVKSKHPQTVEQLVELVHKEHRLPKKEIMKHIIELQNQGKLTFTEYKNSVHLSPGSYLSSSHSYWYWAIITLSIITAVSVFTIPEIGSPLVYVRYTLGFLFVFLLPGYSIIKALFPTRELDTIIRIVISVTMSMTLVVLTGIILNYTDWGIITISVTLSLLALTLVFATVGIIREYLQIKRELVTN